MKCPRCHTELGDHQAVCDCGWSRPIEPPAKLSVAESRRAYYEAPVGLTDQAWYNCCRFFPSVAATTSRLTGRALANVGQSNPLHATSHAGPMIASLRGRTYDSSAVLVREPGEDDV